MATHELKVHSHLWWNIANGNKSFEIRKNDRDFQVGDILVLKGWNPDTQKYTGKVTTKKVYYILQGGQYGLEEGYCAMAIR